MAGFEFEIAADTSKFRRGTDEAAQAVDDLTDALVDMERKGSDALDGVADAGERSAEDLERSYRDALTGLDKTAQDAAGDIKRAFGDNSLTGNDIFDANFRAEVASSARETGGEMMGELASGLASGSYEAQDAITSVMEGMVEVGSEVGGPIGAAAVLGGLIGSAVVGEYTAETEKIAEWTATFFDQMAENIGTAFEGMLTQSQIAANLSKVFGDDALYASVGGLVEELGVTWDIASRAIAGDVTAVNEVLDVKRQKIEDVDAAIQRERESVSATDRGAQEAAARRIQDLQNERAGIELVTEATDITGTALDAATEKSQRLESAIESIPDDKTTDVDVTDNGTVAGTQSDINGIKGTEVPITVRTSQQQAQLALDQMRRGLYVQPVTINVNYQRKAV